MNRIYSEFDAHRAVWAFWPSSACGYRDEGVPLQKAFARFVAAVSMHTPVFVAVSEREYDRARFIIPKHITMYKTDCDGIYADDLHVRFGCEDGKTVIIGGDGVSDSAGAVLCSLHDHHGMNFSAKKLPSGLDFETDGAGTFVVLLSVLESSGLTEASFRELVSAFGNVHKVLVIRDADFPDISVGSVRDLLRFAAAGTAVINNVPNNEANPLYRLLSHVYGLVAGERDSYGHEFTVKTVPFGRYEGPVSGVSQNKGRLSVAGSYLNFMITNQSVVVPLINPEKDNRVLIKMQENLSGLGIDVNGAEAGDLYADGLDFHRLTVPLYR